jgi:hypothetical protein
MASDKVSPEETGKACFVMMPFGEPFDDYYKEVLSPAIRDAGLEPVRADEISEPGVISEQIWHRIQQATLCIADVSNRNPNVMYELGLAHALKKPVVQLVQRAGDLPFDVQNLRSIVYNTTSPRWDAKLREDIKTATLDAIRYPLGSIPFDAPRTTEQVRCTGSLADLFYYSDGKLKRIKEGEEDRVYSPLEDVDLTVTDTAVTIRFTTEIMRPNGNNNHGIFEGSGCHFRGAGYLVYTINNTRQSMGVMVLRLAHAIAVRGFWMTTNIEKGEFLLGRIDLERVDIAK